MAPQQNEDELQQLAGKHAAAPAPLTKREQRRAQKAAKRAAKEAAKQAKRATKAAAKAARKGGGVVAPVAATPVQALGEEPAPSVSPAAVSTEAPQGSVPENQEPVSETPVSPTPEASAANAPEPAPQQPAHQTEATPDASVPGEGENPLGNLPEIDSPAAGESSIEDWIADDPASQEPGFIPAVAADANPYSRYHANYAGANGQEGAQVEANRKRRRRNRAVAAILIVLVCLIGAGTAGAYWYMNNINQNLAGEEEEAKEVKEALTPVPIGDEPFYMLLVGCDDREGVSGARADTTILARLDPKNNQVTLLSIPRDTAIDIPEYGTQKFNAAYTYGGASGTIEAASALCGVEISHYAEVHFEALIDIVDYIGGVDVDVPIAIDDVDAGGKVDAGLQHLDGKHAMIFARSRSYVNGDFQRTTSQRLLIEAAVDKVMNMPPTDLPGLLMKVSECMTTDMSVQELLGLALAFQDEPSLVMYSAMVPSSTATMDEISYVVADVYLLGEMMAAIDAGEDPATVVPDDYTVKSSKEAEEQGIETIPNEGDDVADGTYDYGYYDPNFNYYAYEEPVYTYDEQAAETETDAGYTEYEEEVTVTTTDETTYDDGEIYDESYE